jgi:hypothetical protein
MDLIIKMVEPELLERKETQLKLKNDISISMKYNICFSRLIIKKRDEIIGELNLENFHIFKEFCNKDLEKMIKALKVSQ